MGLHILISAALLELEMKCIERISAGRRIMAENHSCLHIEETSKLYAVGS